MKGMWKLLIGIFAVIVLGGGLLLYANHALQQQTIEQEKEETLPSTSSFCEQNPSITLKARVRDRLQTTSSEYLNSTLAVIDKTSGVVTTQTIDAADGSTGAFDSISSAIVCGHEVQIKCLTTSGEENSDPLCDETFTPEQTSQALEVNFDADATTVGNVTCRVYDIDAAAYVYAEGDMIATAGNYTSLEATYNNSAKTTWDVDSEADNINIKVDCKASPAKTQYGEKVGIAIDYLDTDTTADDFAEPVVKKGGVELSDAFSSLSIADSRGLKNYETYYDLNDVIKASSATSFEMDIAPEVDNDPDNDILIQILGFGQKVQTTDRNAIIGGYFDDDSSATPIVLASAQVLTIDVTSD